MNLNWILTCNFQNLPCSIIVQSNQSSLKITVILDWYHWLWQLFINWTQSNLEIATILRLSRGQQWNFKYSIRFDCVWLILSGDECNTQHFLPSIQKLNSFVRRTLWNLMYQNHFARKYVQQIFLSHYIHWAYSVWWVSMGVVEYLN